MFSVQERSAGVVALLNECDQVKRPYLTKPLISPDTLGDLPQPEAAICGESNMSIPASSVG
jgi:hypothetical protein